MTARPPDTGEDAQAAGRRQVGELAWHLGKTRAEAALGEYAALAHGATVRQARHWLHEQRAAVRASAALIIPSADRSTVRIIEQLAVAAFDENLTKLTAAARKELEQC